MVRVLNETVFLSANLLEKTFSGLCAFALETMPKILVFAFDVAKMFAVEKLIVGSDADVFASSVNPENLTSVCLTGSVFLNEDGEIPFVVLWFVLKFAGCCLCCTNLCQRKDT